MNKFGNVLMLMLVLVLLVPHLAACSSYGQTPPHSTHSSPCERGSVVVGESPFQGYRADDQPSDFVSAETQVYTWTSVNGKTTFLDGCVIITQLPPKGATGYMIVDKVGVVGGEDQHLASQTVIFAIGEQPFGLQPSGKNPEGRFIFSLVIDFNSDYGEATVEVDCHLHNCTQLHL